MKRREFVRHLAAALVPTALRLSAVEPTASRPRPSRRSFSLAGVRADLQELFEQRRDRDGLYGAYRAAQRARCDLYSSCDVALMRVIIGEDFQQTLSATQRAEWSQHINSFAKMEYGRATGEYTDTFGHHKLHANGMVIGALGPLGGRQLAPVKLYDAFASAEAVGPWLETLDWADLWHASHIFWGGLHCFSFSARCTSEWREAVFKWLDANLDPVTGWWRRGTPHLDRHQPLGGGVHIFPIYEHHHRKFPYPEKVIDSTIALQLPEGNWRLPGGSGYPRMDYLDLDALYAFAYMRQLAPGYRSNDIERCVRRYAKIARESYETDAHGILAMHPHFILAVTGIFGLLQRLLPDDFADEVTWSDIFSDRRLYLTREVEVPG